MEAFFDQLAIDFTTTTTSGLRPFTYLFYLL